MAKFISKENFEYIWGRIKTLLAGKMDNPTGGEEGQALVKTASGSDWANLAFKTDAKSNAVQNTTHTNGGDGNVAKASGSFVTGCGNTANNNYEATVGISNTSRTGSADSDRTLFTVGNGVEDDSGSPINHNAFEVRADGSIYIPDMDNSKLGAIMPTNPTARSRRPMINLQAKLDELAASDGVAIEKSDLTDMLKALD